MTNAPLRYIVITITSVSFHCPSYHSVGRASLGDQAERWRGRPEEKVAKIDVWELAGATFHRV
jgi:hypothetical protein